jgi:FKBP-type peptidyl-prolyl cis-trans isomerase FklB
MKLKIIMGILTLAIFTSCRVMRPAEADRPQINTPTDRFSYALGLSIGENLKDANLDTINTEALLRGMNDMLLDREILISPEEASLIIHLYIAELEQRRTESNKESEDAFLQKNKERSEVKELPSGLQYEIIREGSGPTPSLNDKVTTHYHGTLPDGTVFDSSLDREEPVTFVVSEVIPGWIEALQIMPVGSKWKIFVPSKLAYGESGAGDIIEPYTTLIFEVELLAIEPSGEDDNEGNSNN